MHRLPAAVAGEHAPRLDPASLIGTCLGPFPHHIIAPAMV
eukprot:gene19646-biopygen986